MNRLNIEQWVKVNDFLLAVGCVRERRGFCVEIIRRIGDLIPYDQARIYFINDNGKICDEELFSVHKDWSLAYLDYYSKLDNGKWSIDYRISSDFAQQNSTGQVDWAESPYPDEFFRDYIKPQKIMYSMGFGLHDAANNSKCVFMLDRTGHCCFSGGEYSVIRAIQPHLDNLHKNLCLSAGRDDIFHMRIESDESLTVRESEIAALLCGGVTPLSISRQLFLSQATVYKHISNIHLKLHVSNRQELMLKLLETKRERFVFT
jgi:DNA-binding CsgD family transcriptional regulator